MKTEFLGCIFQGSLLCMVILKDSPYNSALCWLVSHSDPCFPTGARLQIAESKVGRAKESCGRHKEQKRMAVNVPQSNDFISN